MPDTFITLTLPAARAADAEQAVKDLSRAWRLFRKREARLRKGKPIAFLAVVERTKKGTPHLHILCRSRWISQKYLSDFMNLVLAAPIVHIRRVVARPQIIGYCAKYVGKDVQKIGTNKRYWQSRDFVPDEAKYRPTDDIGGNWSHPVQVRLVEFIAQQIARGWDYVSLSADRAVFWPKGTDPPDWQRYSNVKHLHGGHRG